MQQRWAVLLLLSAPFCHSDHPSRPSAPRCHVPSEGPNLYCEWDPGWARPVPVAYTLRWEPVLVGVPLCFLQKWDRFNSWHDQYQLYNSSHKTNWAPSSRHSWSRFPRGIRVNTANATIPRSEIRQQGHMSVWVTASEGLRSERSHTSTFDIGAVKKPRTPLIADQHVARPHDLEILWNFQCPTAVLMDTSDISCQAQYRQHDQDNWTEGEEVAQDGFLLLGIQAFSVYVFRVRCSCPGSNLSSDWSDIYTAQTTEAAPVGVLDVWTDSREMYQAVVWKELPVSQARGRVRGYVVAVERAGGNRTERNVSAEELGQRKGGSSVLGPCCHFPLSLLGVTAVGVSAYTSQGRTSPAPLALPTAGDRVPVLLSVAVAMGRRGFIVSWDPPSPLADTMQEYVVQQEEAGLRLAPGFDWTRANKTQRSIILTGDFRNYTPYNLSLFGVFGGRSSLLGSAIAYTQQGVPPAVPEFQVSRISSSDITLTWQHIPLTERRGVIQSYQLGRGNSSEYTVSGGSSSLQVSGLQPGQLYQFWIAAKSEAGLGHKRTARFSTPKHTGPHFSTLLALSLALFPFGLLVMILLSRHRRAAYSAFPAWCFEKVPDLVHSRLFLQMQAPVWTGPCPAVESDPNLCLLEVVEAPPQKGGLTRREGEEAEEWEESGSASEGPAERRTDESSERVEETQFFPDYEEHFMPSPWEVSCAGAQR